MVNEEMRAGSSHNEISEINEEMTAGSSHNETNEDEHVLVTELKKRLDELEKKETESPEERTSVRIFRLYKGRGYDEQYYVPRLASIGPYHYGKPELTNIEKEKDEAMLRMERRIQNRLPERSMKSIVESDMMPMEKQIRYFYADEIPWPPTVLAWMVTRDACFIFQFLLSYTRSDSGPEPPEERSEVLVHHSNIFDGGHVNPTMQNILVDFFLFENQIPSFVLEKLIEIWVGGSAVNAKEELNQIMDKLIAKFWTPPFTWALANGNSNASHLLEALYFEILSDSGFGVKEALSVEHSQVFCPSCNYVPTFLKEYARWVNDIFRKCSDWMIGFGWGFLLQSNSGEPTNLIAPRIPSAVQLNKKGVRFHVVYRTDTLIIGEKEESRGSGVMWIRFDPKTSTLYLPKMIIGPYDEYILRNFIALEASYDKYGHRPMSIFAKFMDELIDNEADVALLCERQVIHNVLGSNQEVADLFNSIAKECRYRRGFKPIDDAKIELLKYERRKYKILCSEFMEAYCSKPWLVFGSISAVLLLLGTAFQVVCLFCKCSMSK